MPRFEQLQLRKQRSREDAVPTFPENYKRVGGDPSSETDEILGDITEVLAEHEATRLLGHRAIEASK